MADEEAGRVRKLGMLFKPAQGAAETSASASPMRLRGTNTAPLSPTPPASTSTAATQKKTPGKLNVLARLGSQTTADDNSIIAVAHADTAAPHTADSGQNNQDDPQPSTTKSTTKTDRAPPPLHRGKTADNLYPITTLNHEIQQRPVINDDASNNNEQPQRRRSRSDQQARPLMVKPNTVEEDAIVLQKSQSDAITCLK